MILEKRVEELRVKSVEAFKKESYIDAIYILEKAWDILPGNKIDEKESFIFVWRTMPDKKALKLSGAFDEKVIKNFQIL